MTMTKAELNDPNFPSVLADPVWDDEVQYFFDDGDHACMMWSFDLTDYESVKALSSKIYYYLFYRIMPKDKTKWNDNKLFSFRNWLTHGCPKDAQALQAVRAQASPSPRLRKNVNDLSAEEKAALIKAVTTVMASPSDDPKGYYQLGGIHWYPAPTYCEHHIEPFLAWHRAYLMQFEDALRSVPGCEDVTVPYWDVTDGTYPALFAEAPFANYRVPKEFLAEYPTMAPSSLTADGDIIRNDEATFTKQLWEYFRNADHPGDSTKFSLSQILHSPTWSKFNGIDKSGNYVAHSMALMSAHDTIHNINGATTANQDVTGFEPVFWLFHANWDRLFWQWQKLHNATTVETFKAAVAASGEATGWIDDDALKILDPFTETLGLSVDSTVDLGALGVDYAEAAPTAVTELASSDIDLMRRKDLGKSTAAEFRVDTSRVSLRLRGVDRLQIPGSFAVSLFVGGELLQTLHFLQPTEPGSCENCVKQALVSFDFVFDSERLAAADGHVSVEVRQTTAGSQGDRPPIPFSEIGNPTINIRLIH